MKFYLWTVPDDLFFPPQSLIGDIDNAMRTFLNYYTVWKQFGGLPEFYNIPQGYTVEKREGYPLRPGKQCLWSMADTQLWFFTS